MGIIFSSKNCPSHPTVLPRGRQAPRVYRSFSCFGALHHEPIVPSYVKNRSHSAIDHPLSPEISRNHHARAFRKQQLVFQPGLIHRAIYSPLWAINVEIKARF